MSRIYEITERVRSYAPRMDIERINRAYVFAAHAHAGQFRSSGEPYIVHPLAVADILASIRMDEASIVAAILHDTVEDTDVTLEDIESRFGAEVARLVDGVTKVGQIRFHSSEHKQAENFRKMLLATARDVRVLIIKLADRLHNMRTLSFLPEAKRRRIAEETLQIYSPLAHRLGMHWIKQEMEDLAFAHTEPEAYQRLVEKMADRIEELGRTRKHLEGIIQEALKRNGMEARVQGRMKHLYSIHQKMQRKHVNFDEIYDLVAFRVIVADIPSCYKALGLVHGLYRPVPGRFKDYIALPKPNGYQSLHTAVIGPENFRIEVQIRTEAMHSYAEDGVAAHWLYKSDDADARDRESFKWLKHLTELIQQSEDPSEFLEDVRLDLFVQEVYVFSRDGDIFALPRGATPLDFAYAVHTDVGNHCIGVRINGEMADFQQRLRNGDQIEVMVSPDQTPSRQWLQYVRTPRARQAIRAWFRRQEREVSRRIGRKFLREALGREHASPELCRHFGCADEQALLEKLGRGDIPVHALLEAASDRGMRRFKMRGMERTLMHAAECCHPIPGDPVLGQFVTGRGMVLHHRKCPEVRGDDKDWIEVHWLPEPGKTFLTGIRVLTRNERGMLARVSQCIAEGRSSIEDLQLHQRAGAMTELLFLVSVEDRRQLAELLRALKRVPGVVRVERRNRVGLKGMARGIGETLRGIFGARKHSEEES
ncbi:MAG: bifunctional (p)ppGpp synthetase/guanosine-3',5'-bis(diphosphate) 3'-pyrophosphohydrolase [Zetaproteobacteria bacterium]|nr:MAG: bifunctional (p)ppGpp synthetase/guanosine-3',5'-bis(diphosphate) 3'-pyrophosphohydrolase [Zetaproteobacteria bacterium]